MLGGLGHLHRGGLGFLHGGRDLGSRCEVDSGHQFAQLVDGVIDRVGNRAGEIFGDRRGHGQVAVGQIGNFVEQTHDRVRFRSFFSAVSRNWRRVSRTITNPIRIIGARPASPVRNRR